MAYTEYKVLHITEGGCGTVLLGSSGIPIKKLEAELNKEAADGWQLVFKLLKIRDSSYSGRGKQCSSLLEGNRRCYQNSQ